MFQSTLVVCLGNICRSSIVERLLQKKLPRHQASSVGSKVLTGNDANSQATKIALKHDVIVAGHAARQSTAEMCERADLILVMGPEQTDMVADIHPPVHSRTILLVQWLPKKTMSDPFNQSSEIFKAVYLQLEEAAQAWVGKLNASV